MPGAQGGNNNTYCHDSHLNYLDWDACAEDASGFARFVRHLVNFRCRFVGTALVHEPTHMCGISCRFAASYWAANPCQNTLLCRTQQSVCCELVSAGRQPQVYSDLEQHVRLL